MGSLLFPSCPTHTTEQQSTYKPTSLLLFSCSSNIFRSTRYEIGLLFFFIVNELGMYDLQMICASSPPPLPLTLDKFSQNRRKIRYHTLSKVCKEKLYPKNRLGQYLSDRILMLFVLEVKLLCWLQFSRIHIISLTKKITVKNYFI